MKVHDVEEKERWVKRFVDNLEQSPSKREQFLKRVTPIDIEEDLVHKFEPGEMKKQIVFKHVFSPRFVEDIKLRLQTTKYRVRDLGL